MYGSSSVRHHHATAIKSRPTKSRSTKSKSTDSTSNKPYPNEPASNEQNPNAPDPNEPVLDRGECLEFIESSLEHLDKICAITRTYPKASEEYSYFPFYNDHRETLTDIHTEFDVSYERPMTLEMRFTHVKMINRRDAAVLLLRLLNYALKRVYEILRANGGFVKGEVGALYYGESYKTCKAEIIVKMKDLKAYCQSCMEREKEEKKKEQERRKREQEQREWELKEWERKEWERREKARLQTNPRGHYRR